MFLKMKDWFFMLPMRVKIVGSIFLLVVITSALLFSYLPLKLSEEMLKVEQLHAKGVLSTLGSVFTDLDENSDYQTIGTVLEQMVYNKDAAYLDVVLPNNQTGTRAGVLSLQANFPTNREEFATINQGGQLFAVLPVPMANTDQMVLLRGVFPLQQIKAAKGSLRRQLLIVCVLLLVIGSIVAHLTWHSVAYPLRRMFSAAKAIRQGDLEKTLPIFYMDEVGHLAQEMNAMVLYLREMASVADAIAAGDITAKVATHSKKDRFGSAFKKMTGTIHHTISQIRNVSNTVSKSASGINHAAGQLADGAESLTSSSEETSSTIVEMASQIQQLARDTEALAASVDQMSASTAQMNVTLEKTAKNGESLLQATSTTVDHIDRVSAISRESVGSAKAGGDSLKASINQIGQRSEEIGNIVSVIQEIADQTNLLALNAAIEAARAGEAGRSFGVVADEVKRLAEHAMTATEEIRQLIDTVQQETGEAVSLTQNVLAQIVGSMEEQANAANEMLRTSDNMSNLTKEIAHSVHENAKGANENTKAAEHINQVTQQMLSATVEQKKGMEVVVKAVESIVRVSQENARTFEEMRGVAASLSHESEALKAEIDSFRV